MICVYMWADNSSHFTIQWYRYILSWLLLCYDTFYYKWFFRLKQRINITISSITRCIRHCTGYLHIMIWKTYPLLSNADIISFLDIVHKTNRCNFQKFRRSMTRFICGYSYNLQVVKTLGIFIFTFDYLLCGDFISFFECHNQRL